MMVSLSRANISGKLGAADMQAIAAAAAAGGLPQALSSQQVVAAAVGGLPHVSQQGIA